MVCRFFVNKLLYRVSLSKKILQVFFGFSGFDKGFMAFFKGCLKGVVGISA